MPIQDVKLIRNCRNSHLIGNKTILVLVTQNEMKFMYTFDEI